MSAACLRVAPLQSVRVRAPASLTQIQPCSLPIAAPRTNRAGMECWGITVFVCHTYGLCKCQCTDSESVHVTVGLLMFKNDYVTLIWHTGDYKFSFFYFSWVKKIKSNCQGLYLSQPWKHSLKSSHSGRSYENNGIYSFMLRQHHPHQQKFRSQVARFLLSHLKASFISLQLIPRRSIGHIRWWLKLLGLKIGQWARNRDRQSDLTEPV